MTNLLQEYFPMIRTREEVLKDIFSDEDLRKTYESWEKQDQEDFLDICTGVRGVKIMYDGIFKNIFDPEAVPERLNELLSMVLQKRVRVQRVLPHESNQIADETTLVIMDIIVELEDGSLANVEVQKMGYLFPGQRASCYSADLLLRQYKRVRGEKKQQFSYKDIKSVYTIVLFEKSAKVFHQYPDDYRHYFHYVSDTGIQLNLLQEYIFISLDIFRKSVDNGGISNEEKAWLAFLCMDEPKVIVDLIEKYPRFKELYEDVYEICRNMEDFMDIFSRELRTLDQNTVRYMIDQMQEDIDRQKEMIDQQKETIDQQKEAIDQQKEAIDQQKEVIERQEKEKEQERKSRMEAEKTAKEANEKILELQNQLQEVLTRLSALETGR